MRAAALAASIASSATTAVRRSGGRTVQIRGSGGIAFPALDRIALTCCRRPQPANHSRRLQQCSHAQYRPGTGHHTRDGFRFRGISRWPIEETFKRERTSSAGTSPRPGPTTAIYRHTALTALAQLRPAAIRSPRRRHQLPATGRSDSSSTADEATSSAADLHIPLGARPFPPRRPALPARHRPDRLSIAETARLARLARQYAAGLSPAPASPSTCAGPPGAGGTRPAPAGTTTTPGSSP